MKRGDKLTEYNEYLRTQAIRTSNKWGGVTFRRNFNEFIGLMKDTHKITGDLEEICCMGIRNGNEYFAFQNLKGNWNFKGLEVYQDAEVYGVDLDSRVKEVGKNCFDYDFNKLPKDWENKFDMVYSNSIDHAFNLDKTLNEWHRVTKKGGYLFLVLSRAKVGGADLYSFEDKDIDTIFDNEKFEIIRVFNINNLSVLLKKL